MRTSAIALCVTAVLGLAACGDDDDDTESGGAQSLSLSVNSQGKLSGVEPVEGGAVKVDFKNDSKLPYDLQIVGVDGNQTIQQVNKVIESEGPVPIPTWLHGAGGVGATAPGKSASSTQVLAPGNYYVIASAQTEGEASPPNANQALKVEGGEGAGELPAADATINAKDYSFTTNGLKAGKNTVRFANDGKELHHAIAIPLVEGATLAQARRFFQTEKGRPPFKDEGEASTVVLDGGAEQVTDLEFVKGKYALVCFITDRKGGPPHIAKGMISEVDIP
jgi:hypothetical protein